MIACILFGLDELLILLFCGLFGLCRTCVKKHRKQGKKACHDHCTKCNKPVEGDDIWRCSGPSKDCGQDRCFDCHDEHTNEAIVRYAAEEVLKTGKTVVVQNPECPKCLGKGFVTDGRSLKLCDCPNRPQPPPASPPPPRKRT